MANPRYSRAKLCARANRHSVDPEKRTGQVEEGQEVGVVAVEPCGNTTIDFEFAEATRDEIALRIELFVLIARRIGCRN